MPGFATKFSVDKNYDEKDVRPAWCGYRVVLMLGSILSVMIYISGTIMTWLAYRSGQVGVKCEMYDRPTVYTTYGYNTPMVVIGPVMMGVGGTIVTLLLLQWCFCRPALTHTVTLS